MFVMLMFKFSLNLNFFHIKFGKTARNPHLITIMKR